MHINIYKTISICILLCLNFSCISRPSTIQASVKPIDELIKELSSSDTSIVFTSIYTLGEMKDQAISAIPHLIKLLEQEFPGVEWKGSHTNHAHESAIALGKIGKPAIPYLLQALDNKQRSVRKNAVLALGEIADTTTVKAIEASMKDDIFVRLTGIETLRKIRGFHANKILIEALDDDYEITRFYAARALGSFHNAVTAQALVNALGMAHSSIVESLKNLEYPGVVTLLIPKLADSNYLVYTAAAAVMGHKRDTSAVVPLIEILKCNMPKLRANAIGALVLIGDKRAVQPLIDLYEAGYHTEKIIGGLGNFGDARAIALLNTVFKDTTAYFRQSAALSLYKIIGPPFIDTLVKALDGEHKKTKLIAIRTLGATKDTSAVIPLIKALSDSTVYKYGISALGQIGDTRTIQPLSDALGYSNIHIRMGATRSLSEMDDPKIIEAMITLLSKDNVNTRKSAAYVLGEKGDTTAVPYLINTLNDTSAAVRRNAVGALGKLSDSRAVPFLVPLLHDDDADVRRFTAGALGKLGDTLSLDPLIEALADDDHYVRRSVVYALNQIKTEKSIEALITALTDDYYEVREGALIAIIELRDRQMLDVLIGVLQSDSTPYLRAEAADGIQLLKDYRAIEPLIQAMDDEHQEVRYRVMNALYQLTGKYGLQSSEEWKTWWQENKHRYK